MIPPAYPAPSPHGYIPLILEVKFSFLIIFTGDDVLVSGAAMMASSLAKPFIFVSKFWMPLIKAWFIYSGKISLMFANVKFPLNIGLP